MPAEWITWRQAAELVGCSVGVIEHAARRDLVKHRPLLHRGHYQPTINRASAEEVWRPLAGV